MKNNLEGLTLKSPSLWQRLFFPLGVRCCGISMVSCIRTISESGEEYRVLVCCCCGKRLRESWDYYAWELDTPSGKYVEKSAGKLIVCAYIIGSCKYLHETIYFLKAVGV